MAKRRVSIGGRKYTAGSDAYKSAVKSLRAEAASIKRLASVVQRHGDTQAKARVAKLAPLPTSTSELSRAIASYRRVVTNQAGRVPEVPVTSAQAIYKAMLRGETVASIAAKTGRSKSTISDIISGKRKGEPIREALVQVSQGKEANAPVSQTIKRLGRSFDGERSELSSEIEKRLRKLRGKNVTVEFAFKSYDGNSPGTTYADGTFNNLYGHGTSANALLERIEAYKRSTGKTAVDFMLDEFTDFKGFQNIGQILKVKITPNLTSKRK